MKSSWLWEADDLARFRVVFAVTMLVTLPSFAWLGEVPDALYRPPPGTAALFDGFPPEAVLLALDGLIAVSLACLALGVWVTPASWGATLAMLGGYGFAFSLGKIDHNILVVLTPAVLSAAGWAKGAQPRPQVLRLWAFTIGTSMLTAGLAKLFGGWLDPQTHAVQGYVFRQVYSYDLTGWLGEPATWINVGWWWEAMDWAAVVVECGFIVCTLLALRVFRIGLSVLALFHLGIMLLMNIPFFANLLAYAAFIEWSRTRWPTVSFARRYRPFVAVCLGLGVWMLVELRGNASGVVGPLVVLASGVVAVWYLVRQAREMTRGGLSSERLSI